MHGCRDGTFHLGLSAHNVPMRCADSVPGTGFENDRHVGDANDFFHDNILNAFATVCFSFFIVSKPSNLPLA